MAKKAGKRWIRSPLKQPKPKVPESEKQLVEQKCNELIGIPNSSPNISSLHPPTLI